MYNSTNFHFPLHAEGLEATKAWLLRQLTPSTTLATADHRRNVINLAYLDLLSSDDEHPFPEVSYFFCFIYR